MDDKYETWDYTREGVKAMREEYTPMVGDRVFHALTHRSGLLIKLNEDGKKWSVVSSGIPTYCNWNMEHLILLERNPKEEALADLQVRLDICEFLDKGLIK